MSSMMAWMPRSSHIRTILPTKSGEYTIPDGLLGLLTTMARVRGVTAASTRATSGSRLPGSGDTTTGTARHIFTISGYETQ